MNIALVVSANRAVKAKATATYNSITTVIDSDNRFSNSKLSVVPWDVPSDWSGFSHILLCSGELDYIENPRKFLEWVDNLPEEARRRVFNPPSVIKWNISKTYLLNFERKGIRILPSVFMEKDELLTLEDVTKKLKQESTLGTLVIKNIVGAGGSSTQLASMEEYEKTDFLIKESLINSKSGIIVQPYFPAIKTEGEWSLVYMDRKFSHAMLKVPDVNGFKVQSQFGGRKTAYDLTTLPKDIAEFGDAVIQAVEEEKLLYGRVDIVRNPAGQPCLMELEAFEPNLFLYDKEYATNFLEALSNY